MRVEKIEFKKQPERALSRHSLQILLFWIKKEENSFKKELLKEWREKRNLLQE